MSHSKPFPGFPSRVHCTPLPNIFFSSVVPLIDDLAELKVVLHIFWLLYQKTPVQSVKFVTFSELLADRTLARGMPVNKHWEQTLQDAIALAVEHGILLNLTMEQDGICEEDIYFLNSEKNSDAVAAIQNGEFTLGDIRPRTALLPIREELPDVFSLYEQNIGMLSPLIAEELLEAERTYPAAWIVDAFKEAVCNNKRSWKYVSRILERWAQEGRGSGESGRHPGKGNDPDKYIKGRYGHIVRR
ncbi:MAG: DnaD domain protein [Chloroflexota bacterium]|nr:DnaD domain protein [Chloroflexota bacterium]